MSILSIALLLFIVLDPFGNMVTLNTLLAAQPPARRRMIMARESVIATGILLGFVFAGGAVLRALGLDTYTLGISGGIVLFMIALGMVFPARRAGAGAADGHPARDAVGADGARRRRRVSRGPAALTPASSRPERAITGFFQDEEGHWVARLECGHRQHMRHQPPWQHRLWVTTEVGRAGMIGVRIPCAGCADGHRKPNPPVT